LAGGRNVIDNIILGDGYYPHGNKLRRKIGEDKGMGFKYWSERLRWREKVHEQYHDLWDLKLIRRGFPYVLNYLRDGERVLDIGAFRRHLEERIKKQYPHVVYKSLDIDPTYPHDYSSFKEIEETFDIVLLFEVIEHLGLDEGREMVKNIFKVLSRGGRVILSTPNTHTPGQYYKDITHLTPYCYEELGALFLSEGFEIIEIRRVFRESFLRFYLKGYILAPLFRFLGIDFSESILLVAKKT
jgi:SAM-dependent methyltransferase